MGLRVFTWVTAQQGGQKIREPEAHPQALKSKNNQRGQKTAGMHTHHEAKMRRTFFFF